MKFPRNAKIFKGHLDATPFAGVFFCLVIFVMLTRMIYTPGVSINLPVANAPMPGADGPRVAVALGKDGQLFYANQIIQPNELRRRLEAEVKGSSSPLTLEVMADKDVPMEKFDQLSDLANAAGIHQISKVRLARAFDPPTAGKKP